MIAHVMSPHVDNLRDATGVARDLLLTELDTGRQVSVLLAVIHARHSSGAPLPLTKRAHLLRPPISIFLQANNVMVSSQPKMALNATGAAGALASWAFSSVSHKLISSELAAMDSKMTTT
ncbi:hypothetical protein PCASD_04931 [Puccinia coronata f. sp. avenae]|uniref:Uncharacterized protein n=1 Tax=Puccinia coronata f. sp. avenae TaxID=200324 RepID=A0A2N5VD06_9BASI|nr:hypothetical protein PCASD_04931 [Puccinia coronata f. sp. avenae]